jgi:ferredoxin
MLKVTSNGENMKVKIDADICIGCTLCVQTCPDVFKMVNDKAVVYTVVVPNIMEDCCKKAADECPVTAIMIGV